MKVRLVILLLLSFGSVRAQSPVISVFDDSTRQLTITRIRALQTAGQFKPLAGNRLLRNYSTASHWLHLRLPPAPARLYYVELDNPRIDQIHYRQFAGDSVVKQVITGDSRPFLSRQFAHYNWVFPVLTSPRQPTDVLIRLAKPGEILNTDIRIWPPREFETHDRTRYLLWGALLGLTLLVLLLNGMVWIATAQSLYGWFMAVVVISAFHLSAASGLGFQYLWPHWPIINDWYPQTLSVWLIVLAHVHFMQQFIGQKAHNSRVFRWVNGFKYILIGFTVLTIGLLLFRAVPAFYFRLLVWLTLLFSGMVIPLAVVSLRERMHRREPIILFYAAITTAQFLTLAAFLLNLLLTRMGHPLFTLPNEGPVLINYLLDLVVMSMGVLYFGFTSYRQQNERLLTTLHEQEQAQSKRLIEALEIERIRMAEDLYDDVGAMLSTAIGYVSSLLRKPDLRDRFPLLTEVRHLLDRAVDNLRLVSHNLMPKNFADLGLAQSLAETIDKVSASSSIRLHYVVTGTERRLSSAIEVQIFRIAVELINAIVNNQQATEGTFQLIYDVDVLRLMTEDDGPAPPQYNNLEAKIAFVNGSFNTDISPDGVTVLVEIPYQNS